MGRKGRCVAAGDFEDFAPEGDLGGLAAAAPTLRLRLAGATAAFALTIGCDYIIAAGAALRRALRFVFLFAPLRRLVLRAAPRADAALRVDFRFAPFLFFFAVIGMSNDSSCVFGPCDSHTPKR